MKRIVQALALLAWLATPAWAGFDEGVAALQRGDFAAAFREFKPLADSGNARAQFNLGVMYTRGLGASRDDAEAVKWFRRAARQDHAGAQHNLGVMYTKGKGGPRDFARAVEWYRLAAAQGSAIAMNNLGVMHAVGRGAPRDLVKAYAWYDLAAARFPPGPQKDGVLRNRGEVAKELSPERLGRAWELVRRWDRGDTAALGAASAPPEPRATAPAAPSRLLVIRIQNALAAIDYDPGPIDGIMGPRTRRAIRAFEAARKLPVTGKSSPELLREIEQAGAE